MLSVTLFVDADAPTGGNGLAWSTAFDDLQAAFESASVLNADADAGNDVDAIWIAEGVYRPSAELESGDPRSASFSLVDGVTLYGGFAGVEATLAARNLGESHETVLSGDLGVVGDTADNAYTVVYCGEEIEGGVDAVTIRGGNANNWYVSPHEERKFGGAIYNFGTLMVTDSTIAENSAQQGGAIYNRSTLTIIDSSFLGNSAYSDGGGICSWRTLTVTNSTFSGNVAGRGGAISSQGSTLMVTNSTIAGNVGNEYGGGIFWSAAGSLNATLNNTITAGNHAPDGSDVYLYSGSLSGSNNLIGNGSSQSGLTHGQDGNLVGTETLPIDPQLSDLTRFANGRWGHYLLTGSPAIDAGVNALARDPAGDPLTADLRGNDRILGAAVDIGAVEGATPSVPAKTYVVTSLEQTIADDGVLTFIEAFEAANRNQSIADAPAGSFSEQDIIRFATGLEGTISLVSDELEIFGGLSIEGPGSNLATFDAQGVGRVFCIRPNASVNLSGITITGGSATSGGGICISHAGTLTITDSVLSQNAARYGGGIHNSGVLTIANSTIAENSAYIGGGIRNENGTVTITNCTIMDNAAESSGGGLWNSTTLTVTNSTLSGNSAGYDGGAVHNNGVSTVTNCTLADNSAAYGGGISNNNGELTVTNSTLSGNSAYGNGGGVWNNDSSSTATLNNAIVAGNGAQNGPDLYAESGTFTGAHNLIGDCSGQSNLIHGQDGNLVGTTALPIDPLLSDLTQSADGAWGYFLLPGSPAIDAGADPLAVYPTGDTLVADIYGNARFQGAAVDIGAVEGTTTGVAARAYIVTSLDEAIDEDGVLTFIEAFEAANGNRAIGDAPAGSNVEQDVIQFATGLSGTVWLDDGELEISGDLRIEGPGSQSLMFDAQGSTHVFSVRPGASVDLYGITVSGGSSQRGGGIRNLYGMLTVTNSLFTGNSSSYRGGGVYNSGALTLTDCTVVENSARYGGGIFSSGTLTIANSTLSENNTTGVYSTGTLVVVNSTITANTGRGICNDGGTATVTDSTISENSTNGDGAGIYSWGTLSVTHSTITRNSANSASGGGICNDDGTLTVVDSTITENSCSDEGGGIYCYSSVATVINCVLAGNTAGDGGGVYDYSGTLTITNSTLVGNSAYSGGAIHSYYQGPTITNCTLAGNSASLGGGIRGYGGFTVINSIVALNGEDGILGPLSTESTNNVIAVDPKFVRNPGTNGPDDYGDLRLRPDSPAIDAGDNTLLPVDEFDLDGDGDTTEPIPVDLAGSARVVDGDADGTATVDMGAYEFIATAAIPGDLNGDGTVSGADLDIIRANWGQSVTPGSLSGGDPSGDGTVGGPDLDIVRANWGQTAPAASISTSAATAGEEDTTEDAVYGPTRENEDASTGHQNLHTLADAAWANAVTAMQTRAASRQARAVDRVMLEWDIPS